VSPVEPNAVTDLAGRSASADGSKGTTAP
jgi:hypothetical protein